jgi:hypothetical protein
MRPGHEDGNLFPSNAEVKNSGSCSEIPSNILNVRYLIMYLSINICVVEYISVIKIKQWYRGWRRRRSFTTGTVKYVLSVVFCKATVQLAGLCI